MPAPSKASIRLKRLKSGAESVTEPSVLTDTSGNGRTLTKNGTVADRVSPEPKYGKGYDLDGNSANYLSRSDAALRLTGDTWAWFVAADVDVVSGAQTIGACDGAGTGTADNILYRLTVLASGLVRFDLQNGSTLYTYDSKATVGTGFHGFLVVRDNPGSYGRLRVYVDGTLLIDTAAVKPSDGGSSVFALGRSNKTAAPQALNGGVYECRIWGPTMPTLERLLLIADPEDGSYAGVPQGDELACWFLGAFPTQETVLEESLDTRNGTLLGLTVDRPQSVGSQSADLAVWNRGGKMNDWEAGQVLRVEAKRANENAYSLLLEGVVDSPVFPGGLAPRFACRVAGLNSLLDHAKLREDQAFADTPYTTIFSTIAKLDFPGYALVVTADAAYPADAKFQAGMKLREIFDWCRRGLIAKTGQRWEVEVRRDGATKQLHLYKRAVTVTRVLGLRDVIGTPMRYGGALSDVINKAQVYGATGPAAYVDRSPPRYAAVGSDATWNAGNLRAASPLTAQGESLTGFAPYLGRDVYRTVPTLTGWIARNSDNRDLLTNQNGRPGVTVLSGQAHGGGDDQDNTSVWAVSLNGDNAFHDVVVYDFGPDPPPIQQIRFRLLADVAGTDTWEVASSDDNGTWTVQATYVNPGSILQTTALTGDNVHRYWRLRYKLSTGSPTANIQILWLQPYKNVTADAVTNPQECIDNDLQTTGTTISQAFATTRILATFTASAGRPMRAAKVILTHNEAITNNLVEVIVSDGASSNTVLPSTSVEVTDTILYKETQTFTRLDVSVADARASGAAHTDTLRLVRVIEEVTALDGAYNEPLVGDVYGKSTMSWSPTDHPVPMDSSPSGTNRGLAALRSFGVGDVPTTPGQTYWPIIEQPTLTTQGSWFLDIGDTTIPSSTILEQAPGGTTWTEHAGYTDRSWMFVAHWDTGRLEAVAQDVASQLRYAGIIPHGQLVGALSDEVLQTMSMVEDEADALVDLRKDLRDRIELDIPGDATQDVGNRITLDQELCYSLGISDGPRTYDCVSERPTFGPSGWTKRLVLNDHAPSGGQGIRLVAALASARTL